MAACKSTHSKGATLRGSQPRRKLTFSMEVSPAKPLREAGLARLAAAGTATEASFTCLSDPVGLLCQRQVGLTAASLQLMKSACSRRLEGAALVGGLSDSIEC